MSISSSARKRAVALASASVLLAGLSGCTKSSEPPAPTHPSGSSTSATTPPATSGTAAPAGRMSPLGVHWDPSRTDLFRSYLQTIPNTYTYYELVWCKVERNQGTVNWRAVDKAVDFADSLHIETMLKIRVGSCWATEASASKVRGNANKTESNMPADMAAYSAFVSEVVKRYSAKGVHEYAVENEVNSPSYWGGTPQQFVTLTKAAATAIRAADPAAKVVDAGMSSTTYGYGIAQQLLDAHKVPEAIAAWNDYYQRREGTRGDTLVRVSNEFQLRDQIGQTQGQRNLTYLGLAKQLSADHTVDVRQVHFYEVASSVPALMSYLKSTTPSTTPVEVWEAGIFKSGGGADVASSGQADEMTRTISALLAGGATKVLWLPLAAQPDNKHGEEVRGGLLAPDGAFRPASRIVKTLVDVSTGATIAPSTSTAVDGVGFTRDGTTALLVWAPKGSVKLTLGSSGKSTNLFAGTTTKEPSATVGTSPQLLTTTAAEAKTALVPSS